MKSGWPDFGNQPKARSWTDGLGGVEIRPGFPDGFAVSPLATPNWFLARYAINLIDWWNGIRNRLGSVLHQAI
jgi:hypothetical protein